ncbi:MAG: glucokinase [Dissulfurimicrobium sp.]|uniref:glucokinase n=1 Tax=Dissulfurimicrobium sp. TaxID=2022436 RepID=UPI00404B2AB3
MRVLAGDIGGTHTRLAIYDNHELIYERQYPSRAANSVTEYLNDFIKGFIGSLKDFEKGRKEAMPQKACLAIAGVIEHGKVMATNLPWTIESEDISRFLGMKAEDVKLINDFEAAALGITLLRPDQFIKIGGMEPKPYGIKAIIGAGTGLGEAIIVPIEKGVKVIATEGGHADFAPANEIQIELLRYLIKRFGHVSTERVLSGPGLVNIYRFLIEKNKGCPAQADIDPTEITKGAIKYGDTFCIEALNIFSSIYGSEAGNLALRYLATGGVYLGGGIATKIIPFLTDGRFREAFESKGRMSQVLKNIPVFFVTEPRLGLIGARITAQGFHAPS